MENTQDNLFEGIPSLEDENGMQNYVTEQDIQAATEGLPSEPAMLQQSPEPAAKNPTEYTEPVYTKAQVDALIAQQLQQQQNYMQQAQQNAQRQQSQAYNSNYVNADNYQAIEAQKQDIINRLRANGVPEARIQAALNEGRQRSTLNLRMNAIEQQLQAQQYQKEESAFVDKMVGFGNKFGLTENDLVTFANKAYSQGMNVAQIPAEYLENVFRAVYPQQYAVRMQRMSTNANTQLYGGVSVNETPRASASKAEDAYVEAFLRGSMPNQYKINK